MELYSLYFDENKMSLEINRKKLWILSKEQEQQILQEKYGYKKIYKNREYFKKIMKLFLDISAKKIDNIDLIETIAILLETEGDKTKASEFYERLVDVDPKNKNALQKLAEFRESIGDNAFDN